MQLHPPCLSLASCGQLPVLQVTPFAHSNALLHLTQTVYRGRWNQTNVAIVRMRKGGTVTEARMMQELSGHPNLVQFYR